MAQDITDNDLALFSDYPNTDSIGTGAEDYGASTSHESDENNFVQGIVAAVGGVSDLEAGNIGPTEPSQAYWSLLPSNGSLGTDDSSVTTIETVSDIPDNDFSRTSNYEKVSVEETTSFGTQSTRYTSEMSADIYTTMQSTLRNEELAISEHSDTTISEEETTRTTITETSVTEFTTQMQDQSPSTDFRMKSLGDNGASDVNVVGDSRSQVRPIQSRVGFGGLPMVVLTDQGVVKAHPSVVRAETEIMIHGDKVRHRNVELQNRDLTPNDAVTQTTYHRTELSGNVERWTTGDVGMVTETLSHRDTTAEVYPAVRVSETGADGTGTSFVDDVVTTSLQQVSEDTVVPATGTTVSSESGEVSLKLYGDTKLLQDFHLNSVIDDNEFSRSQTKTSSSVLATELDHSLFFTAPETLITTEAPTVSKDENIGHNLSETVSTDVSQISGEEPNTVTESNEQNFLTQTLYKDTEGTGLQVTPSELSKTDTQSQPAKSESEISKNILKISDVTNEMPLTILYDLSVDEMVTSLSGQTVTPSGKFDGAETGHIPQTSSEPSLKESDSAPVLRKQDISSDCDAYVGSEPTKKPECITENIQSPDLSEPHETSVFLRPSAKETESVSMQTERFSASETFTEPFSSQQLNEITTLPSNIETTISEKQTEMNKSEESASSSTTAGYQLRSGVHSGDHDDSSLLNNAEDIIESIPPPTIIHTEIVVTSMLPVLFNTVGHSGSSRTVQNSKTSSTVASSIPSIATPAMTDESVGVTTHQTIERSPLCGVGTSGRFPGTQCWLVQFMNANSSSPVCVGSYLDASTIVTSANCVSRSEQFGLIQFIS
jgi:hypothetical protein